MGVSGRFVDGAGGRILIVSHDPVGALRGAVVVLPALADEMNKSRRLVWSLGQRLAGSGIMTVVPDLFGTGDSDGDFRDADWRIWCDDIARTIEWARDAGATNCHVLLVRFGALLYPHCADALADFAPSHRVGAWQPEHRGADAMRQLLRMKVMADRVTWGKSTKLAALQQQLADAAAPTEIAGYEYSASLAAAIGDATFDWSALPPGGQGCLFDWTRAPADDESPPPVARVQIEGQRFWTAVEPSPHPQLVEATADFFAGEG